MELRATASLILPGLEGILKCSLDDQRLEKLIQELLKEKALLISYTRSKEGYLEIGVKIPLMGEKSINVAVESIELSSDRLIVMLRFLNVGSLLMKGVLALIGKPDISVRMEGQETVINLSEKWMDAIADLPSAARDKLDRVKIGVAFLDKRTEASVTIQ